MCENDDEKCGYEYTQDVRSFGAFKNIKLILSNEHLLHKYVITLYIKRYVHEKVSIFNLITYTLR